ncbi:MAG: EAL domain-containing protein [Alphaproteobacteria bacterium]|nr:EAL domain-containing protein [Alphaproteobacteria bacterium]
MSMLNSGGFTDALRAAAGRWKDRLAYLAVCGLVAVLYLTGSLDFAERQLTDLKFQVLSRPASGEIVLVEMDAQSLEKIGVWPWPRRLHAEVLDRLMAAGASRVAFDVDFSASASPADDARFAAALSRAKGRAALPVFTQRASNLQRGTKLVDALPQKAFRADAALAAMNIYPSPDGLVRNLYLKDEIGGRRYATLAALLAGETAESAPAFSIDFAIDPDSVPRLSFDDVLHGRFDRSIVAGKQVVIGSTAAELGDHFVVPTHVLIPGPLVHILGADSLIQGRALASLSLLPVLLLAALAIGLSMWAFERMTAWQAALFALAAAAAILAGSIAIQSGFAVLADAVPLVLSVFLSLIAALFNRIDKQSMRLMFQSLDLRRKNEMMRNLVDGSTVGIVTIAGDGRIETSNAAAADMFGYRRNDLVGMRFDRLIPGLARLSESGRREYLANRADGGEFPVEMTANAVGDQSVFVAFVSDITLRMEQERLLKHQAEHDALTGLPNRVKLSRDLSSDLATAATAQQNVAVFLLDLDGFKDVNDTLGHDFGDRLLQEISRRLSALMPQGSTLSRFGGDEFVFFVSPVDGVSEVEAFGRSVLDRLKQPIQVDSISLEITGSVGAAIYPYDGATAEELIQRADIAMYSAKRERSGYARYWAEGDIHSVRNLTLTGDLRQAIENDGLELAFQPKIDLKAAVAIGVEALCRWKHPVHGFVSPDEFIGHAEQSGLIMPLTQWVLDKAIETGAMWRECGRDLSVAVNLSARLLHHETIFEAVCEALEKWRYPADRLTLEVTETALLVNPAHAMEMIGRFSALGIKVSIDDFGTGYSSLSYLATLKADELKIDKSFVFGMLDDSNNGTIVKSVISMAHDLGLRVVAEGVETAEVMEALRLSGCDIGQGYFFGKPLSFAEFENWYGLSGWAAAAAQRNADVA